MVIPLQKVTATAAIVESLKERIRRGEFAPGSRLPSEQVLLKEYGVSRLTLREGLARLAAVGIIEVQHGKGAYVKTTISIEALDNVMIPLFPQHDLRRMNDLIEARNMIESEMASKAAEKRTPEQILLLRELLEYKNQVFKDGELFAERDYAFHLAIAEIAGNQFLLAMYQALYRQIRAFLLQYAQSLEDRETALERHRPILNAIINQDATKARELAREHASICASYVKKMLLAEGVQS